MRRLSPVPALFPLAAAVTLGAVLPGCFTLGEWDFSRVRKPTIGQELLDLKAARDGGALSNGEYEQKRVELLHPDGGGTVRLGG